MKHRYRIRRKSGTDKNRIPIFADDLLAATDMACNMADDFCSTMLVEHWNAGHWVKSVTAQPGGFNPVPTLRWEQENRAVPA